MYYVVFKDFSIMILLFVLSIFLFVCATRSLLFLVIVLFSNASFNSKIDNLHFRPENVLGRFKNKYFKRERNFVFNGGKVNDCYEETCATNKENMTEGNNDHLSPSPSPFISILIASYNENIVIDRLLLSLTNLEYGFDKFEIIIVDDSSDNTPTILKDWQKKLSNLKVVHRENRDGWKGGALNIGIGYLSDKSDIVLVLDADNVLKENTLKQIASYFASIQNKENNATFVIQGYPVPTAHFGGMVSMGHRYNMQNPKMSFNTNDDNNNWVSRGISFRLSQRNLIEFVAKEKLGLPLPITGSLFAIKTSVLKSIGFSKDLCEDWDLTLDIYLSKYSNNKENNETFSYTRKYYCYRSKPLNNCHKCTENKNAITFNAGITSFTEATKQSKAYFNQRKRVSEGHTRGFKKRMAKILKNNRLSLTYKIELLLMGLRYAKYIPIVCLIILDFLLLYDKGFDYILKDNTIKLLMGFQGLLLFIYLVYNAISIKLLLKNQKQYYYKDVMYLLLLNIYTIPAFVCGSILGFVRNRGSFYRTTRNEAAAE